MEVVQDGNIYHIDETATTPGIDIIVDFIDVTTFDYVQVVGNYNGGTTHSVSIQLYNWTTAAWHTWDSMDGNEATITNHGFWIPCPNNYIGTGGDDGKVRVRLIHTMSGNSAHDLYVDVVALYDREAKLRELEDRIDTLEGNEHKVVNVYDETTDQTEGTYGSKGTSIQGGSSGAGGVYVGKCKW